jgi:SAM-dependent methyltransferase
MADDAPGPWPDIRASYDVVAATYADRVGGELAGKPADRDLLDQFAAAVAGRGPVWDVGCGAAGHVTRYLADRGVAVIGADLSPGVVAEAGRRQPGLHFRVADLRELPVPGGSLAGIVAFWSVIHLLRPQIPVALAEFRRALAPGGSLLIAMHGPVIGEGGAATAGRARGPDEGGPDAGDPAGTAGPDPGEFVRAQAFGHPVELRATLVTHAELTVALRAAGLSVRWSQERGPDPGEMATRRIYAWARRAE